MDVSYTELGEYQLAQDKLCSHRSGTFIWAFIAVNTGVLVWRGLSVWYVSVLLAVALCKTLYHSFRMLLAHRQVRRLEPRVETFRQYWNDVGKGVRSLPERV